MTNKTEFWLIRHGETAWNAAQKLQGWVDIPLNENGRQQAANLQRYFQREKICAQFDLVLSSDLQRAAETALIALEHRQITPITDPRLRERSYGIYEGQHWRDLMRPVNSQDEEDSAGTTQKRLNLRQPDAPVPEGESLIEFNQRIQSAFESLAQEYAGQRVAVFAHGGVIDIVWRHTHQLDLLAQRPRPIPNTSINHFEIKMAPVLWQPIRWEITDHLNPVE